MLSCNADKTSQVITYTYYYALFGCRCADNC